MYDFWFPHTHTQVTVHVWSTSQDVPDLMQIKNCECVLEMLYSDEFVNKLTLRMSLCVCVCVRACACVCVW